MDNENNSKLGSRSENRDKIRKANRVYNILLAIVIVAIIAVAIPIFSDNDNDLQNVANDKASENTTVDNEESNKEKDSTQEEAAEENTEEDSADEGKNEDAAEGGEGNTIVENSGDSNVSETYVNDSWEPVGTTQTGEHVTNYTSDSVDWQEMTQAIAYGAGLSVNNMTVWYIGNGGSPNKAIGTVSSKNDSTKTCRVYIEWEDGQGWKPVKVELLKQNDKAS